MTRHAFAVLLLIGLCLRASADTPPSSLPSDTPGSCDLTVQVVGQHESMWCWATSAKMVMEYVAPLPRVPECVEANYHTHNTDCCTDGSSAACDKGGPLNPLPRYPFTYSDTPPHTPMTFDQLRYQVWVSKSPVGFAWSWVGGGGHVMVVTGYSTDSQGNQYVWINNPEPVGKGSAEVMPYSEFCEDTSPSDPYGAHTHQSDCWNYHFTGTRLIWNLTPRTTRDTLAISTAQAPALDGTVLSDRSVPFTLGSGNNKITGKIQERVAKEKGMSTLDFYYRIFSDASSHGDITGFSVDDFSGFSVAPAYRTDGLGSIASTSATRNPDGSKIDVTTDAIGPGKSSRFILLLSDARKSVDHGKLIVNGRLPGGRTPSTQLSTDEPIE